MVTLPSSFSVLAGQLLNRLPAVQVQLQALLHDGVHPRAPLAVDSGAPVREHLPQHQSPKGPQLQRPRQGEEAYDLRHTKEYGVLSALRSIYP